MLQCMCRPQQQQHENITQHFTEHGQSILVEFYICCVGISREMLMCPCFSLLSTITFTVSNIVGRAISDVPHPRRAARNSGPTSLHRLEAAKIFMVWGACCEPSTPGLACNTEDRATAVHGSKCTVGLVQVTPMSEFRCPF